MILMSLIWWSDGKHVAQRENKKLRKIWRKKLASVWFCRLGMFPPRQFAFPQSNGTGESRGPTFCQTATLSLDNVIWCRARWYRPCSHQKSKDVKDSFAKIPNTYPAEKWDRGKPQTHFLPNSYSRESILYYDRLDCSGHIPKKWGCQRYQIRFPQSNGTGESHGPNFCQTTSVERVFCILIGIDCSGNIPKM